MPLRALITASLLVLLGAGCALTEKISSAFSEASRFRDVSNDAEATTHMLGLAPGLAMTVRPSAFGLTGAVEEAFGDERRVLHVIVREASPETHLALEWNADAATGTLELASYASAEAMLLPAFWPAGEAEARNNGGLWMPQAAFARLKKGEMVEWRLGLAEQALSGVAKALQTFNSLSATYAGASTSTLPVSPFLLRKSGTSETFPLLIDGKLVFVRVLRASSWFADFFVLDHPEHPLILKVVIHPVVQPALKAFAGAPVRWDELGYEITAVSRP